MLDRTKDQPVTIRVRLKIIMSCVTESCVTVQATVQQWMDSHPQQTGIWGVSDYQKTGDIGILVTPHKAILAGLQTAEFNADLKRQVIKWLDGLTERTEPSILSLGQG